MKKLIFLTLFSLSFLTYGQKTVSGTVTDSADNQPIPGASIIIKGTTVGVSSDFDGNFTLEAPTSEFTLVISYLGYKTIEQPSNGQSTFSISLSTDALQLADVVVTANKTAQRSQEVPASITAIGAVELAKTGAVRAESYFSSIPNLSISSSGGGGASFGDGRSSSRNIAIRGISGQNTTAFYLDETPLPEFADPRLFDISRVEVLRGPQGTLYGSNTLGGAVKVITNQPSAFETSGSISTSVAAVTEGEADYNIEGVFNLPLIKDKFALRVGAFYSVTSGVYDRRQQTSFNGFPINSGTGTTANPNAVIFDQGSGTVVPYDGGILPIKLEENGNNSLGGNFNDNIDGEDSFGVNASLGIYPNENITIVPKFIYQKTKGSGLDFADFDPENFTQYRIAGIDEVYELDLTHGSLLTKFKIGNGELTNNLSVSSVAQYDREDVTERENAGGSGRQLTPFNPDGSFADGTEAIFYPEFIDRYGDLTRFVEELRYSSASESKFNYTIGAFYANEKSKFDATQRRDAYLRGFEGFFRNIDLPGLADFIVSEDYVWYFQDSNFDTREFAIFGEGYWDVTDKLKFTFGMRYFSFTQDFFQSIRGFVGNGGENADVSVSDNGFTPKFNLTYKLNENSIIYGSATRGFRLGGGNGAVPLIFAGDDLAALGLDAAPPTFDPDYLWTYEVGSKNTLLGNRFIANFSLFHTVWNDLQQRVVLPSGFLFVDNIGQATLTGVEIELKGKVSENLQLGAAFGYTDARVTEGSAFTGAEDGDRILNTPEITGSANIEYSHKVGETNNSMFYRVDASHTGERYNTFTPETQPQFVFDAFTIFNARVGYISEKFDVALFAQNFTNTIANYGDILPLAATPPGRIRYAAGRPSSFGVSLKYKF